MANSLSFSRTCALVVVLTCLLSRSVSADYSAAGTTSSYGLSNDETYYNSKNLSCLAVMSTIRAKVFTAVALDNRMGASLLRLHFHDCFVNGCDGSVLLDNTTATNGEKNAFPNINSLRGFELIDQIKSAVELLCPKTVSCADILAIAARDSVDYLYMRGLSLSKLYKVELGRKDSKTASMAAANANLPPPFFSRQLLIDFFGNKTFTPQELVILSGGHTIGKARCGTFRGRIDSNSEINNEFANGLKEKCKTSNETLADLDSTATAFDNTYFKDLQAQKGLLHSDQQLYGGETQQYVDYYVDYPERFLADFGAAMIKMGRFAPAGTDGEIRTNCRKPNPSA